METREEQVRNFVAERITYKDSRVVTMLKEAAVLGMTWADAHPQNPWISVEERLPESQQQCELYDHAGYLRHGFYMAHKKKWIGTPLGCDIPEYVDITHWRYTEPPKLK